MFWEEDEDKTLPFTAPEDVVDLNFDIRCKSLPLDHAWALYSEIKKQLSWIEDEPLAGIHQIHVAESNNGWMRPEDNEKDALLYPSRRTKLSLRIPAQKIEQTQTLTGKTLNIEGHELTVGTAKKKEFTNAGVIFARYVASSPQEEENDFLTRIHNEIKNLAGFNVKKMICGKSHSLSKPDEKIFTRHLMIADLDNAASIKIQQEGLGEYRQLGCGLFIPHKGIKTLKPTE